MAVAKQLGTVLHNSQEGKSGGGIEKADTIRSGSQRGPEDGAADVNDEDGDDDDDEEVRPAAAALAWLPGSVYRAGGLFS